MIAESKYVVDTSSLMKLIPSELMKAVGDQNVAIFISPTVVDELEGNRTRANYVGYCSREWLKKIEEVSLSEEQCELEVHHRYSKVTDNVEMILLSDIPSVAMTNDGRIIASLHYVVTRLPGVSLLSEDRPMRIKSRSYGYEASSIEEEFPIDLSNDDDSHFNGEISSITMDQSDICSKMQNGVLRADLEEAAPAHAIVKVTDGEELSFDCMVENGTIESIVPGTTTIPDSTLEKETGVKPQNKLQSVAMNYLDKDAFELPLVSLAGKAGTGKSLMAMATACRKTFVDSEYKRVLVVRNLSEMGSGQEMGFLPGNLEDKMDPWKQSVRDVLDTVRDKMPSRADEIERVKSMIETGDNDGVGISVSPISYMRGRTITNTFLIIEEAQNFSMKELLNVISRAGEGTKVVLTWDPDQVDNPRLKSGSLCEMYQLVEAMKSSELFAHIELDETLRSPLAELAADVLNDISR